MSELSRLLILTGACLVPLGLLLGVPPRLPGGLLPGDIVVHRKHVTIVFPVVTCLVASVLLTLLLNWFGRG